MQSSVMNIAYGMLGGMILWFIVSGVICWEVVYIHSHVFTQEYCLCSYGALKIAHTLKRQNKEARMGEIMKVFRSVSNWILGRGCDHNPLTPFTNIIRQSEPMWGHSPPLRCMLGRYIIPNEQLDERRIFLFAVGAWFCFTPSQKFRSKRGVLQRGFRWHSDDPEDFFILARFHIFDELAQGTRN